MRAWMPSVLLLTLLACGRDRTSGAAPPADSAQTMVSDTASPVVPDTSRRQPATDTARPASAAQSPAAQVDTAAKVAPKPAARKSRPKPAAPAAAAPSDTARAVSPSSDTATAATPTAPAPTPSTEVSAPLRDQYHTAPLDTVSQEVYDGWKQYNLNCARCHGEDVQGTTIAPHLLVSLRPDGAMKTKELFVQTVCAGRPEKGMPSWCALGMEMEKINQIFAYVKGRSEAKIHPGRPAVKAGG